MTSCTLAQAFFGAGCLGYAAIYWWAFEAACLVALVAAGWSLREYF
jgi:hypothetical protein